MVKVVWETRIWYGKEDAIIIAPGKFGRSIFEATFDFKTIKAAKNHVTKFSSAGARIIEAVKL